MVSQVITNLLEIIHICTFFAPHRFDRSQISDNLSLPSRIIQSIVWSQSQMDIVYDWNMYICYIRSILHDLHAYTEFMLLCFGDIFPVVQHYITPYKLQIHIYPRSL